MVSFSWVLRKVKFPVTGLLELAHSTGRLRENSYTESFYQGYRLNNKGRIHCPNATCVTTKYQLRDLPSNRGCGGETVTDIYSGREGTSKTQSDAHWRPSVSRGKTSRNALSLRITSSIWNRCWDGQMMTRWRPDEMSGRRSEYGAGSEIPRLIRSWL